MTHSTIRLWDHRWTFLAADEVPNSAIDDNGDRIELAIANNSSPIRAAILTDPNRAGLHLNSHITIDDNPTDPGYQAPGRRGGIIREISFHAGTLVLLIDVHSRTPQPETIYPPHGYGIGLPGTGNSDHAILGCWATEDEARAAIADLRIYALGTARPGWDQR